jgi:hypothetical protein
MPFIFIFTEWEGGPTKKSPKNRNRPVAIGDNWCRGKDGPVKNCGFAGELRDF